MIFLRTKTYRDLVACAAQAEGARLRAVAAEKEAKRLLEVVLTMKRAGFEVAPEALDEPWPGGKYVMDEPDAETLEGVMAAQLNREDHDMIEKALLATGKEA